MTRSRLRHAVAWTGVICSTLLATFWAFWGAVENFHEGWYYRGLWQNLGLMLWQYMIWSLCLVAGAVVAVRAPRAGALLHLAMGLALGARLGFRGANGLLFTLAPIALGALNLAGPVTPRRWALRLVVGVPLTVTLAAGAWPAWRVWTRPDRVELAQQTIAGNGVTLVWAPAGPGWPDRGFSWDEASRRCRHLNAAGDSLLATPPDIWRLPTAEEAVRSLMYRGANAGGVFDAATRRARYRVPPDKDAPLWNRYSRVIYWWTADTVAAGRALRIVYNGQVHAIARQWGPDYMACRCVRAP